MVQFIIILHERDEFGRKGWNRTVPMNPGNVAQVHQIMTDLIEAGVKRVTARVPHVGRIGQINPEAGINYVIAVN